MNSFNDTEVKYFLPVDHAKKRMAQRNLSLQDVHFVIKHGQELHRAGAVFFFLRKRDIPEKLQVDSTYTRLEGTVVVVSRHTPLITTVYRNRKHGLGHIKRKIGWDRYHFC